MKLIVVALFLTAVKAKVEFEIVNREVGPVWIGIRGNEGHPHLENGGFILAAGKSKVIECPENWSGHIWPRTWCDQNSKHCLTGDCGNTVRCEGTKGDPPYTRVDITLSGEKGLDSYAISLEEGFNIPAEIEPIGVEDDDGEDTRYSCRKTSCPYRFTGDCDDELQVKAPNGVVVGCKAACLGFNLRDADCKSSELSKDYAKHFKDFCFDAKSYTYDEKRTTFTCSDVERYKISFGLWY